MDEIDKGPSQPGPDQSRHRRDIRRQIETEMDIINRIAAPLVLLQHSERETLEVPPYLLGVIHEVILDRMRNIREALGALDGEN